MKIDIKTLANKEKLLIGVAEIVLNLKELSVEIPELFDKFIGYNVCNLNKEEIAYIIIWDNGDITITTMGFPTQTNNQREYIMYINKSFPWINKWSSTDNIYLIGKLQEVRWFIDGKDNAPDYTKSVYKEIEKLEQIVEKENR